MGAHKNISLTTFPRQSDRLGKKVLVYFIQNGLRDEAALDGEVVRDDLESPHHTIFKLEDGRHVLSTECIYRDKT